MKNYAHVSRVVAKRLGLVGMLASVALGSVSCVDDVGISVVGQVDGRAHVVPETEIVAADDTLNMTTIQQAVGEPVQGYPNYEERVLLYLTNRTRSEPDAFRQDITYPPTAPLRYDLQLSKAARWFAQHFIEHNACWCEDHSSCCEMGGTGDAIGCSGPVAGCGVMTASGRVGKWSNSYAGENMAKGQRTPLEAIEAWISSDGHWENMNEPSFNLLGPGNYKTGWVQDFGRDGQARPVAEDGIHFGTGGTQTFASMYYQLGSGGPRTALVIVDGECHDLSLKYGVPEQGAFEKTVTLGAGCHRYYFHFTDGKGEDHVYPTTGSFGVGVGSFEGECPLFDMSRPADTCSPSGQSCKTGDTRSCYTGPYGTADVGICKSGSERCIGGKWNGVCKNQVLPEEVQSCGLNQDDNCDGQIDEGCPVIDIELPDTDGGETGDDDAGNQGGGTGSDVGNEPGGEAGGGGDGGDRGGCSMTGGQAPSGGLFMVLFGVGMLLLRRYRSFR